MVIMHVYYRTLTDNYYHVGTINLEFATCQQDRNYDSKFYLT